MKYFSMFTGVGGFELGLEGHECVGMSEIDKYANMVLKYRFPEVKNYGDATKINPEDLPEFDMLVGGFPCQAFSIAGKRRGFQDTRGTLFFEIARIIKAKRPKIILLENVKGLLNHNKGETFRTIIQTISELGYNTQWMVLNSKFFGVPQNRERVFIIGSLRGECRPEILPFRENADEVQGIPKEKRFLYDYYNNCITDRCPTLTNRMCHTYNWQIIPKEKRRIEITSPFGGFKSKEVCGTLGAGCGIHWSHTWYVINEYDTEDSKPEIGQAMRRYGTKGISPPLNNWSPIIKLHRNEEWRCREFGSSGKISENISPTLSQAIGTGGNNVPMVIATRKMDRDKRREERDNSVYGQQFEPRKDEVTNTISSFDKDNYVISNSSPIEMKFQGVMNCVGTCFGRRGCSKEELNMYKKTNQATGQLRRLTPRECERLQGFPSLESFINIEVHKDSICIDHQKSYVNVEIKNHKLRKHVGNVENNNLKENVLFVEKNLDIKNQQTNKLVQENVLISCEDNQVQIHNQEKSYLFANYVKNQNSYLQHIKTEDFVQLIAGINSIVEKIIQCGKVELLQNEQYLIQVKNGKIFVKLYGKEMMQLVKDVKKDSTILKKHLKYITSNHSNTKDIEHELIISFFYAMAVIIGCIQKETPIENSLNLNIYSDFGWTLVPNDKGKPMSDTQRYKMMGNAVTVNVIRAIGKKLKQKLKGD